MVTSATVTTGPGRLSSTQPAPMTAQPIATAIAMRFVRLCGVVAGVNGCA
jgi:hypothetical protein